MGGRFISAHLLAATLKYDSKAHRKPTIFTPKYKKKI